MAFEPKDGAFDRDVDASMRMFQKSQVGPGALISATQPQKVLVVLDGSSQDQNAIAAAVWLKQRFQTTTLFLDAREVKLDPDGSENLLSAEVAAQVDGASSVQAESGEAYDQILDCISQHSPDLVVVPSPFGRSFDNVGVDSIGTVLDVLLARCPVPMLVVRRDDQLLSNCVQRMSMIVGGETDVVLKAASWIFGFSEPGSEISLNLVVEREQFENLRSIVEAIDPAGSLTEDQVSEALAKSHQAIHAAMRRTSEEQGLAYKILPQAGEVAPPNPLDDSLQQLLVMPLEVDDRFTQGFVHDRIRRSPHPVLIVPSHVVTE